MYNYDDEVLSLHGFIKHLNKDTRISCFLAIKSRKELKQQLKHLLKEPNTKKCIIKRDNVCVTGPYETMSRFHP